MPFIDSPEEFTRIAPLTMPEPLTPSFNETLDSVFAMENDVANAWELMQQPVDRPESGFDLPAWLRTNGLWEERDGYIGVRSTAFAEFLRSKRAKEQHDREVYLAAGFPGIVAGVIANVLSPTSAIPLIGPASKGLRAVKEGAGLTLLAAGLQEAPLYANQETRTGTEVAFSLAASTVLGGILGGAAGYLKKSQFDKMALDMADAPRARYGFRAIPNSTDSTNVGSEVTDISAAGGLKKGKFGSNELARISPIARGIAQDESPMVRYITGRFGDAGLTLEGNIEHRMASPGGNVENLAKSHRSKLEAVTLDDDAAYRQYIFGDQAGRLAGNVRAVLAGFMDAGKLTKDQFHNEVGRYLFRAEPHPVPEINKVVQSMRQKLYEPTYKEAVEVGVFKDLPPEELLLADPAYANRIYVPEKIVRNWSGTPNSFVEVFGEHFNKKLQDEFATAYAKYAESKRQTEELVEDLSVDEELANSLKAKWMEDLDTLEKASPEHLKILEEDIESLRAQRRKISPDTGGGKDARSAIAKEIEELRKFGGDAFPKMKTVRANIKRRLRNLSRARVVLAAKQQAKLDRIEKLEDAALASMNRAVRAARRFLKGIDSFSDKEFDKQLKKVRALFDNAAAVYDKGEERLVKLTENDADADILLDVEARQQQQGAKLTELSERLGDLEGADRAAWQEGIQMGLDEMLERTAKLNMRRGARADRLRAQAKALDPSQVDKRIRDVTTQLAERTSKFISRFEGPEKGGVNIDINTGAVDFSEFARQKAQELGMMLRGVGDNVALNAVLRDKRGPTLARLLDIHSSKIEQFLETDAIRMARTYIRSMSADIEMTRVFGDANAYDYLAPLEEGGKLAAEEADRLDAVLKAVDKEGNPLPEEAVKAEQTRIAQFYDSARQDLSALIERVRGIRGAPRDPGGAAERFLSFLQNLNVLRFMGGVTIASIPDAARHIQAYGLKRAYRDGFQALITDLKAVKMNAREGRLAGVGNDVELHSRAHALTDVWEDFRPGTKFERGIQLLTDKMGLVGLFDYWTAGMKGIASHMTVVKTLDAIDLVLNGTGTKAEIEEATEFLARGNLSPTHIRTIWEQVTNGKGGGKVNGTWVPETAAWDTTDPGVRDALRAFRASLAGHVDRIIVTPGLERPLIMDKSPMHKALFQFKSFGMSSTTKTLMAGLQENDARYVQGVIFSLGLGALSYYLWAVAAGGDAYEEMMKADFDRWVDEAITRSGQTAIFDEIQRIGQRVPGLAPYMSLSGQRSSRREGGDLTEALLGPSFDALQTMTGVIAGVDEPTQHTLHLFRQLLPFQNLFFLRQVFDMVEASTGLPETRDQ